ncbi:MarR family transcriptional regulator [Streptomyces sp. SID2888]|uniref:MarR family winged helix-turn-helix transcriptional regulator n=1 Tax=Streptomyces TaxID=1883 RepID=UPI00136BB3A7|nr:MarR family transcriptional regulator [Streptomyces sp. SID2888]MYV44875.1 MarR family transcriptional regulator [Streptomyces sp. SID2888]
MSSLPSPADAPGLESHPGLAPGDTEPTDALVQIAFTVMGVLTRVAAEHDVSLTQLRVLGILRDRRPRMAQLAAFLGLEKSTMSGLINRAEQRGLLRRVRNAEDARAWDVVMTDEGLKLAARVHRQVEEALKPLTDGLDQSGEEALNQVTRLIRTGLSPAGCP